MFPVLIGSGQGATCKIALSKGPSR